MVCEEGNQRHEESKVCG